MGRFARLARDALRGLGGWRGVASSSDAAGFERTVSASSLVGKTYLVTGSTSGIGKHTAWLLALHGGTVLVHGRSLSRVKRLIRELRAQTNSTRVYGYCYDLSSLAAAAEFAAHVRRDMDNMGTDISVLIHNAGVFEEDHYVTSDGLERTWAVNMASPFLLTAELLPLITDRIVNVSSISMSDKLDWDNLQSEQGYGREGHEAYGTSKLATNMWSYLLADKLAAAGSSVSVTCVDPGTVATKILFQGWGEIAGEVAMRADEADDEYWAATAPELAGKSGYYVNRRSRKSAPFSYDREAQERLWSILEQQTGARYDLPT